MKRLTALFLAALVITPAAVRAQSTSANLGTGNFPVGVTVMVSADVPVEKWLETQSFNAKSKAQAERFAAALRAQGVPSQDITTLPVQTTELALLGTLAATTVVVSADPAVFARVAREARSYGMRGDTPQMTPADAQALYNQAVALAIERGRATAQAIAAADHQHVGRLLNFVPSPVELAKQLAAAVPAAALMAVGDTTKVTATGIATFELVP